MVTTIKDTVKILPRYFYKNRNEAIIDEINHKYSNKVHLTNFWNNNNNYNINYLIYNYNFKN